MIIILLKSLSNVNLIIIEDKRRAKLNELGIVIWLWKKLNATLEVCITKINEDGKVEWLILSDWLFGTKTKKIWGLKLFWIVPFPFTTQTELI